MSAPVRVDARSRATARRVKAREWVSFTGKSSRPPHTERGAPAYKHPPLIAHDDGMVGHGRHIGAARRARAVHHRDLRDALRREARLIEKYSAEVLAVGKYFILLRQKSASAFDQVDARQLVVAGNLLCPQMLLHGERIVGSPLHRRGVRPPP